MHSAPLYPPQTTLAASLVLCGLTPSEAALWLDVEEPVLRGWLSGRRETPQTAFTMLAGLYLRITDAALAASVIAGSTIGCEVVVPARAYVNDEGDPYPGHGEVMAGAMAVLMALGHDERDGLAADVGAHGAPGVGEP